MKKRFYIILIFVAAALILIAGNFKNIKNNLSWFNNTTTTVVEDDDDTIVVEEDNSEEVVDTDTTTHRRRNQATTTVNYSFTSPSMGTVINDTTVTIKWDATPSAKTKLTITYPDGSKQSDVFEADEKGLALDGVSKGTYIIEVEAVGNKVVGAANTSFDIDFNYKFAITNPANLQRFAVTTVKVEWECNVKGAWFSYSLYDVDDDRVILNSAGKKITKKSLNIKHLDDHKYAISIKWRNAPQSVIDAGEDEVTKEFIIQ